MKILPYILVGILSLVSSPALAGENRAPEPGAGPKGPAAKILFFYYSKTGNTKALAEVIQGITGGEMFQIQPLNPYPNNYKEATEVAKMQLEVKARPEVAAYFPEDKLAEYDVIFLGYPIWWGTLPMPVFTFLEHYNLAGKTIVPFCTQGGSGLSRSVDDIKQLFPNSTVTKGIAVKGPEAKQSEREIKAWLREIGLLKK